MSKLIAVSNEAYGELTKRKSDDKSFSDVILEIVRSRERSAHSIMRFAGIFKGDREMQRFAGRLKSERAKLKMRSFEGL